MGFFKRLGMLIIADAVVVTCIQAHRKAKLNYAHGRTYFGKPIKKTTARKVDGKTFIFMTEEDYNVA